MPPSPAMEMYWGTRLAVGCLAISWFALIGMAVWPVFRPPSPPAHHPWTSIDDEHEQLTRHP